MASMEILLSSPCGYYGELALWPFRNLRYAAAAAGDDGVGAPSNPRSHFTGIRLVPDGSSWRCEASLDLSPELRAYWVRFASLEGAPGGDEGLREHLSYSPSEDIDHSDWDRRELSAESKQAARNYAHSMKQVGEKQDRISRDLAASFLPRLPHALDPVHHANYELPCGDDSFRLMSDWISINLNKLLRLRYEQVDELLADVAHEFTRKFWEGALIENPAEGPLDVRINLFLMASSSFFVFLSRILRLHWYLGHDDWKDVIGELDGEFPHTRPPSFAWIYNHRNDAPWWECLSTIMGNNISEENKEFLEHDLIALTRAWLWPGIYRRATEDTSAENSLVLWPLFAVESTIAERFPRDLAKLGEWWTYILGKCAIRPLLVTGEELDSIGTDGLDLYTVWDLLIERTESTDDLREGVEQRLSSYRSELIEAANWETRFHEAFPSIGKNLTLEELLQKDHLGFALKKLETEVEGESAWVRLVHNAVFEDAYGPQALAARVKEQVRGKLFAVFGSSAITHAFIEKSNHCQMLLREFVRRILKSEHGDSWLERGVPESVAKKVRKQIGEPKLRDLLSGSDAVAEFFRETTILDYILILQKEANRPAVEPYLRLVGIETSAKGSISCFWDWKDKRNAAAHPEKANGLSLDDLGFLDDIQRYVDLLLLLTDSSAESSGLD